MRGAVHAVAQAQKDEVTSGIQRQKHSSGAAREREWEGTLERESSGEGEMKWRESVTGANE